MLFPTHDSLPACVGSPAPLKETNLMPCGGYDPILRRNIKYQKANLISFSEKILVFLGVPFLDRKAKPQTPFQNSLFLSSTKGYLPTGLTRTCRCTPLSHKAGVHKDLTSSMFNGTTGNTPQPFSHLKAQRTISSVC